MNVFPSRQARRVLALLSPKGVTAKRDGIVGYLADRGFLVPKGTDEFRKLQYAFGRQHYRTDTLELILLASEDCNFRCTYCYEDFARGTMKPEVRSQIKALVESRLGELKYLRVSWFGGEPLYGFEAIEDLAPYFLASAEKRGIAFGSHMTTNGYLLTPEVADKLLAWRINDFQITLDGPADSHDQTRPARDGGPTFSVILDNLRALAGRKDEFSVVIRVNFGPDSRASLERLLDIVSRDLGDDHRFKLSFKAIGRWGGPNDESFAVCGVDEADHLKTTLRAEARRRGLQIGGTLKEVQGPGAHVCYAARPYNFIIGADGSVMKCTIALHAKDYNVVGQLGEGGELELDEDKMALWTEPAFESDAQCKRCVITPTCQGIHCPKIRIEENRRPCPDVRLSLKRELRELGEELSGSASASAGRALSAASG